MLSEKHMENLLVLATFLQTEITDEQFDISEYRQKVDPEYDKIDCSFKSRNNCGTIGCALGWSPFVIKPIKEDFYFRNEIEGKVLHFGKYSERVFGCQLKSSGELESLWEYMFSTDWQGQEYEETREGTVKRILEVVANGGVFNRES